MLLNLLHDRFFLDRLRFLVAMQVCWTHAASCLFLLGQTGAKTPALTERTRALLVFRYLQLLDLL